MTKEEFLELAHSYMSAVLDQDYNLRNLLESLRPRNQRHEPLLLQGFSRAAETGGVSGGSCWESSNPQAYQVSVTDTGIGSVLDPFLESHVPAISFLTYRKLCAKASECPHTDYEYYGNRTDYLTWTLSFEDAWEVLEPLLSA